MAITEGEAKLAYTALQGIVGGSSAAALPPADMASIAATEEFIFVKAVTGSVSAAAEVVALALPFSCKVLDVGANVKTANANLTTLDVNKNGTTILATKLTIDGGETSSSTAAAPYAFSAAAADTVFAAGDELQFDVDNVAAGTPVDLWCWAKVRRTS